MKTFEQEIIAETLTDMKSQIEKIQSLVETIYTNSTFELTQELFREIHSIKGNAMAANLADLAQVTHQIEDTLIELRDAQKSVSVDFADILSKYCDECESYIKNVRNNPGHKHDFSQLFPRNGAQSDSEHFLLVDDEPDLLDMVEDSILLEFANFQPLRAENGIKGLEIAMQTPLNFIITDYKMPLMNGEQFIRALRLSDSVNAKVPIIMLSAFRPDIPPDKKIWDEVYFLDKPVNLKQLYFNIKVFQKTKKLAA